MHLHISVQKVKGAQSIKQTLHAMWLARREVKPTRQQREKEELGEIA